MNNNNNSPKEEVRQILEALKEYPNGASADEILKASGLPLKMRSLQRRLSNLIANGEITTTGKARAVRYHLLPQTVAHQPKERHTDAIPLTAVSKDLLRHLSQPIQRRVPVGYQREFLESYRPNADSYLTREEVQRLAELGNTAKLDQPAGTYARQILNRLLIDLSWNSSRLEGNTYTLLDTERLISLGEASDSKSAMDAQMILNHKDAIEFIVQSDPEIRFNRYTIQNLHGLLANNLLADPEAPGRLRSFGVGIARSVYTPLVIPQLIEEYFDLLLQKAEQIKNPFEQSFFIMVQLPYLQPFDDVNKRVSRLAANIPFNRHNLSPLSFIDVPEDLYIQGMLAVYELNRVELLKDVFLWAYGRSAARYAALRQSLGEPNPFRLKYRDAIRTLITQVISQAMDSSSASEAITSYAEQIPEADRSKFIEAVETELLSLHDGNFARYWIRPSEFRRWKAVWNK
ncbi:Fic family protein [Anseongella ginsenosidimutans]|uniref:Fic family protein n=1 Tax=Anseongella ginsenosidimutans TaxID=496056 RepID=A0A4R3KM22_9SPHI|nr:Fic family protein [Anseongella ginsenosidimutans]QEC52531.1 Fic family protein [Anseongella ginsenosidimutans]TCS85285.1 Fic family protein [Anseongella ginsenosidimutans]